MLKNGKESCVSKSRHILITYFFTKDAIKRENMEIVYCPTNDMIANFYTKPLQGKQLYRLRDIIMGKDTSTVKECVDGSSIKDTIDSTKKHVSRKRSKGKSDTGYCISSNFD